MYPCIVLAGAPLSIPDRCSHAWLQMGDAVSQLVTFSRGLTAYGDGDAAVTIHGKYSALSSGQEMVHGDLKRLYVLPS